MSVQKSGQPSGRKRCEDAPELVGDKQTKSRISIKTTPKWQWRRIQTQEGGETMKDVLNATQAAAVLRCAPMKVKKRIEIGEWPWRIIPKNKTGLTCDTIEMSIYELGEYFHISEEEIWRRLAERKGWVKAG